MTDQRLFERVVDVTRDYLGPAADRFIARQITNHLHKEPQELDSGDLVELIDWLKLSMAFLTDDESLISRYVKELQSVAGVERQIKKSPKTRNDGNGRKVSRR